MLFTNKSTVLIVFNLFLFIEAIISKPNTFPKQITSNNADDASDDEDDDIEQDIEGSADHPGDY